jgi:hypothetical protein
MAALCLDARLMREGTRLPAVYATALAAQTEPVGTTVAGFRATLREVSAAVDDELGEWLTSTEPLPVESCLSDLGYALDAVEYEGFTLRSLVLDVLGVTGFSPQRPEILGIPEAGSLFAVGDLVVRAPIAFATTGCSLPPAQFAAG